MIEYLPLLMFVVLFLVMFSGFPVAFCLFGVGFIFACIGHINGMFELEQVLNLLPKRIYESVIHSEMLMAVPLFILMGMILERSRIAEDLLQSMSRLLKRWRGGLALSVVVVGALMAASTGIVGATVVTMTVISLPTMLKAGYDKSLSCGTIAASGTLGQIIPPSIVLILLGDQMNISVGKLFQGAMIPGMVLVGMYMIYVLVICHFRPSLAPNSVIDDDGDDIRLLDVLLGLIPPLVLIIFVLGSIIIGVATPTEASGCGAVGAFILAVLKRRLGFLALRQACMNTVQISAMVIFILAGSQLFSLVFQKLEGNDAIISLFSGGTYTQASFILLIMLVVFVLGFFLDFLEICFIIIPILMPLLDAFAMNEVKDKVFIGVLLALNLQTSFMTPPFGFSLFYLKGSAPPEIKTSDIYKGIIPFVLMQILLIVIVWYNPWMVRWMAID